MAIHARADLVRITDSTSLAVRSTVSGLPNVIYRTIALAGIGNSNLRMLAFAPCTSGGFEA
jgi:hypothetical protein